MGDIERTYRVYACRTCGAQGDPALEPNCEHHLDDPDILKRVEVVPAEQLAGAVEALEIALDGLERTNRDTAFGYEDKKAVEDYVRGTLKQLGGR